MNILETMVNGRNTFFQASTLRSFSYEGRLPIATRYILNESAIIEVANRVYSNHINTRSVAAALISLSLPITNASIGQSFMDPVTVTASLNQINSSLEDAESSNSGCSICQETISSNAVRIRQCGHVHHRSCIMNWLSMSVRCPVCRYDIREVGQANQTSPALTRTSSQSEDQ